MMKYDPATATFEDDGGPSLDPKPLPRCCQNDHARMDDDGAPTLTLNDRFAQVLGD